MEKAYNIKDIIFEEDYLILTVDDVTVKYKISEISEKLFHATESERNDYKVTPSGYGIHWRLLDEDLSINGLLNSKTNNNI
jgi:hypothetical protein